MRHKDKAIKCSNDKCDKCTYNPDFLNCDKTQTKCGASCCPVQMQISLNQVVFNVWCCVDVLH